MKLEMPRVSAARRIIADFSMTEGGVTWLDYSK